MVFTCERKQMLAGQAILSETATTVQSQEYALEDIVRQHARLVYRIVYGVLRNHHEAEDATQETFVRVLRYGKKLGKIEDHRSWLARIAWRVAVDRSQQHSRKREIPLESFDQPFEEFASSEVGAEQAILGKQVGARLEKLVAALPEKLRAPLLIGDRRNVAARSGSRLRNQRSGGEVAGISSAADLAGEADAAGESEVRDGQRG